MKSLYESIISNTNIGIANRAYDIITSDNSTTNYNYVKDLISVESGKNGIIIKYTGFANINTPFKYDKYFFDAKLPKIEKVIDEKGNIHPILFDRFDFGKTNITDLIVNASGVDFVGCTLDIIDELPKGCAKICFSYASSLAGKHHCKVNEIKNISIDSFKLSSTNNGLTCPIEKINNISVKNEMYISHGMLGWDVLGKGGANRSFTPAACDKLDEFFKNNNVKITYTLFIDAREQTKTYFGKIVKNKDTYTYRGN